MSDKEAILHVKTDAVGSECEIELGISIEEYNAMGEKEQIRLQSEFMWNVLDVWVD